VEPASSSALEYLAVGTPRTEVFFKVLILHRSGLIAPRTAKENRLILKPMTALLSVFTPTGRRAWPVEDVLENDPSAPSLAPALASVAMDRPSLLIASHVSPVTAMLVSTSALGCLRTLSPS
jgi:hypothetical protein